MRAVYTLREIRSPCGAPRGIRLIIAQDNAVLDGKPSFAPEFQITFLGDLPEISPDLQRRFLREARRFYKLTGLRFVPDDAATRKAEAERRREQIASADLDALRRDLLSSLSEYKP